MSATPPEPGSTSEPTRTSTPVGFSATTFTAKYGVLVAMLLTIVVFSLLRPEVFPTLDNAKAILQQVSPLMVVAAGLTVVLVMDDFDLSLAGAIGLGGAVAVVLMSSHDVSFPLAVLAAIAVAAAIGAINGILIAWAGASSFIITLATGQVLSGLEYQITDQRTIFEGVDEGYVEIASGQLFGLSNQIYIAAVAAIFFYVLLEHTAIGRYMYAIGGNMEAARLSGLPVRRLRVAGFVLVAICAVGTGLLLTSSAASYNPGAGNPFFLPAFAAAFLGRSVLSPGRFHILGTVVGAIYLEIIATGLTMLQLSTAVVFMVQGAILAVAVLLSRLGKGANA